MFIDGEGQSFAALVQSGIRIETHCNGIDKSKFISTPFLCESASKNGILLGLQWLHWYYSSDLEWELREKLTHDLNNSMNIPRCKTQRSFLSCRLQLDIFSQPIRWPLLLSFIFLWWSFHFPDIREDVPGGVCLIMATLSKACVMFAIWERHCEHILVWRTL